MSDQLRLFLLSTERGTRRRIVLHLAFVLVSVNALTYYAHYVSLVTLLIGRKIDRTLMTPASVQRHKGMAGTRRLEEIQRVHE